MNEPHCLILDPLTCILLARCQDLSEDEGGTRTGADAGDEDSDDDERHAAMLADIRGGDASGRKRKRRDAVISEAYPESEYNLNPVSATAGAHACNAPASF